MASRSFTKVLAIIGGIFIIIEGILAIVNSLVSSISIPNAGFLVEWYYALIAIVVGIIVLWSCDVFTKKKGPAYNGWLLIILGILGIIFTYWHAGGALVVIAGILWIVWKK